MILSFCIFMTIGLSCVFLGFLSFVAILMCFLDDNYKGIYNKIKLILMSICLGMSSYLIGDGYINKNNVISSMELNINDLKQDEYIKQGSKGKIITNNYIIDINSGESYTFNSESDYLRFNSCKNIKIFKQNIDNSLVWYDFIIVKEMININKLSVKCY